MEPEKDIPVLVPFLTDFETATTLSWIPHPLGANFASDWQTRIASDQERGGLWFIIEHRRAPCGCLSLVPNGSGQIELELWLAPEFRGTAFGMYAVETVCGEVFTDTDVGEIVATRFADNPAAGRMLEKIGFIETGRIERFCAARQEQVPSIVSRLSPAHWVKAATRCQPRLHTERLNLRPWDLDDLDAMMAFSRDAELVAAQSWIGELKTRAEAEAYIRRNVAQARTRFPRLCWQFVIETGSGGPLGGISAELGRHGGIGWWLARSQWDQGFATEAARVVLGEMFKGGVVKATVQVGGWNKRSRRVAEKLGFVLPYEIEGDEADSTLHMELDRDRFVEFATRAPEPI